MTDSDKVHCESIRSPRVNAASTSNLTRICPSLTQRNKNTLGPCLARGNLHPPWGYMGVSRPFRRTVRLLGRFFFPGACCPTCAAAHPPVNCGGTFSGDRKGSRSCDEGTSDDQVSPLRGWRRTLPAAAPLSVRHHAGWRVPGRQCRFRNPDASIPSPLSIAPPWKALPWGTSTATLSSCCLDSRAWLI